MAVTHRGTRADVLVASERDRLLERFGPRDRTGDTAQIVRAPMPGLVLRVHVQTGQTVGEGDRLIVLEAMKMENELHAATPGVINAVHVSEGEPVEKDQVLVEIEPRVADE